MAFAKTLYVDTADVAYEAHELELCMTDDEPLAVYTRKEIGNYKEGKGFVAKSKSKSKEKK